MNPGNMLSWRPRKWDDFVGNRRLNRFIKKYLKLLLNAIVRGELRGLSRPRLFISGPSRSGKTCLVEYFVLCLLCNELDSESLSPCDFTCSVCNSEPILSGHAQMYQWMHVTDSSKLPVHFYPIDCSKILAPRELRDQLAEIKHGIHWDGLVIVYLDEVHRLAKRDMDDILMKFVEERNYFWILSTAEPLKIDLMLKNRFLKLSTELPEKEELSFWLADRCKLAGIKYEPEAILRVVEKSNRVPGIALHALALAELDPSEGVTIDLVENQWEIETKD